ncbi:DUF2069 domain-containing protein [Frateuria defendens]|uniref:DUF2069 domain-containing protein n=1 Tax=Frateuria defendens TaxID=2219559 RepID=UPI00066FF5A5|nr:DUF2069 domain-containing protein [Frateuria defendens]
MAWQALFALQLAWHGWLFPPTQLPRWLVLAIAAVPLLLPLAAIRRPRRALLWAGILALFYFSHGVAEAWSTPAERGPAIAEIALALGLIGTLGAGVRRRAR